MSIRANIRRASAILLAATAAACNDASDPVASWPASQAGIDHPATELASVGEPLRVLTRNVYLGGDTGPVFGADFSNPLAVLQAANGVWAQVQNSNFPERADAVAHEIQATRPHVVALQELFRFVLMDGSFQPQSVDDQLAMLLAAIEKRGLPYTLAAVQSNTSSALPLAIDFTTGQVTQWMGFTDQIAMLIRDDVDVLDVTSANYAASFPLAPGVEIKRGWIRASVMHGGTVHHVVGTHLETQGLAPIQASQAAELVGSVVAGLDGVTIVAGDLNSDAEAGPGEPSWTPTYQSLLGAGFVDAWLEGGRSAGDPGFTCCQAPDLRNQASGLDQRIDFILVRASDEGDSGAAPSLVLEALLLGDTQGSRTRPTGLWTSDHAGLFATVRIRGSVFSRR